MPAKIKGIRGHEICSRTTPITPAAKTGFPSKLKIGIRSEIRFIQFNNMKNKNSSVNPATAAAPKIPHLGITKKFDTMFKTAPAKTIFKTSLNRSAEINK